MTGLEGRLTSLVTKNRSHLESSAASCESVKCQGRVINRHPRRVLMSLAVMILVMVTVWQFQDWLQGIKLPFRPSLVAELFHFGAISQAFSTCHQSSRTSRNAMGRMA